MAENIIRADELNISTNLTLSDVEHIAKQYMEEQDEEYELCDGRIFYVERSDFTHTAVWRVDIIPVAWKEMQAVSDMEFDAYFQIIEISDTDGKVKCHYNCSYSGCMIESYIYGVRIKWMITDDIKNMKRRAFDSELNKICGCFELHIGSHVIGYCPEQKSLAEEKGSDDILYWMLELAKGMEYLHSCQGGTYEIQLPGQDASRLILSGNAMLQIELINTNNNEVVWMEESSFFELYKRVCDSVNKFISEIQLCNYNLSKAKLIQQLIKVQNKFSLRL